MAQPTGSDLHIDTFLSNLSVAYMNEPSAFIADKVFPVVTVGKQSDKYPIYAKDYWFRDEVKKRAILTESSGGGYEMATPGTFYCDEYGYHKDVPDQDVENADDPFDLDEEAVEFVTEKFKIRREREWATNFFGTGVWGTDWVAGADFDAWDGVNAAPITDIESAKRTVKQNIGMAPNTLVVAERVHSILINDSNILDRFKYTQTGVITEELLAKVFQVERYLVAGAIYAANAEGDTEDMEYIMNSTDALLCYVSPRPAKRRPSAGYTFRWNRPRVAGRSGDKLPITIKRFRMEQLQGTRIEGSVYEDLKLVAADCGLFFSACIT
jgi:hypothetical protein